MGGHRTSGIFQINIDIGTCIVYTERNLRLKICSLFLSPKDKVKNVS